MTNNLENLIVLVDDAANGGVGPMAGDYNTQALIAIAVQLKRLADAQAK